jgi:hypothetical protein
MQVLQLHSINQLGSLAILYQFRCTGIYESDEKVIQYCGTGLFSSSSHSGSSSSWFGFSVPHRTCPKCREAERRGGAVISCLNCFLEGDSLRLFPYSVPPWFRFKSMLASSQATCLMAPEDPPRDGLAPRQQPARQRLRLGLRQRRLQPSHQQLRGLCHLLQDRAS